VSRQRPEEPTTPGGHTPEEPAPSELGALGTPGAGMTPDVPHPADADLVEHGEHPADPAVAIGHHDDVTHIDAQTVISHDDHGHAEPRLGPIDWPAWGFAVLGVVAGLLVVVLFYVAIT
jgi:hypothetical protein